MTRKKRAPRVAAPPPRRAKLFVAIGVVLAAVALVVLFRSTKTTPARKPTAASIDDPTPPPNAAAGQGTAFADMSRAAWEAGAAAPPDDDSKWRDRMQETRDTLLKKWQYPPYSQALAGKVDLIPPHFVPPTIRPLTKGNESGQAGKVSIKQTQDRLFMSAGEQGIATFAATVDGAPVPITITRSDMMLSKTDATTPPKSVGAISFKDDGVAPDAVAGDGVYSTFVPPSLDVVRGFGGEILIEVDLSAKGETGTLQFRFGQSGAAPARFTQTMRHAIEDGSLVFYVGVEIYKAGRYNIHARLYDAKNEPVVFMTFVDEVTVDTHAIRLVAFGKLLRDLGAMPPYTVKDIEGWRYALGSYPDRDLMDMWSCNYATGAIDPAQLSPKEWDSPMKQARLKSLDDNLKNGPSEVAPVDSNGIPLPPKPLNLPPPPQGQAQAAPAPKR